MTMNAFPTLLAGTSWANVALLTLLLMLVLYLARTRMHAMLRLFSRALTRWLSASGHMLERGRVRVDAARQEAEQAAILDLAQRRATRRVQRFSHAIERDLGSFPQLQRRLTDQIERIDRDFHESADTPPVPPQWLEAVAAVAEIRQSGNVRIAEILDAMHGMLTRASQDAMDEFRFSSRRRHGLLRRLLPQWRRATWTLDRLEGHVSGLQHRAESVQTAIDRYVELHEADTNQALGSSLSHWVRFVLSVLALAGIGFVAATEFSLLLPAFEALLAVVPAVFGVSAARVEVWVILIGQLGFGLLLLDVLHLTQMLPVIDVLGPRVRRWMGVLLALLWLATVVFAATMTVFAMAVNTGLGSTAAVVGGVELLALLTLPAGFFLETALVAGRIVVLALVSGTLGVGAGVLRGAALTMSLGTRVLIALYDLVIFIPLGIAGWFATRRARVQAQSQDAARTLSGDIAVESAPQMQQSDSSESGRAAT